MRLVPIACILVSGCVVLEFPNPKTKPEGLPPGPAEIRSAQAAAGTIAVGRSTKADVRAALGKAIVLDFESGYEVWVYKERLGEKGKPPATELVLLFDPAGTLTKTRIR